MRARPTVLAVVASLAIAVGGAWAVPRGTPATPAPRAPAALALPQAPAALALPQAPAALALPQAPAPDARLTLTASGDFSSSTNAVAVFDQIAALDPALHLAVGDLSYGTTGAEQAWCDLVTGRVGAGFPFQLVAGNHESNGLNGNINDFSACLPNQLPGLVGTYGRQWYVDVPQVDPLVRVIAISPGLTYPSGDWSYAAGSARHTWTAGTIDAARAAGIPWVVVGMHMPCLSVGVYGCASGTDITDLLAAKRVDLVVMGHEHSYMRTHQLALATGCPALATGTADPDCIADTDSAFTKSAGTVFATVGTGGIALRDITTTDGEAPYFATWSGLNVNPTWGNLRVDLTPTSLSAQFLRASGGTFTDAFTVTAPGGNSPPVASWTSSCTALACTFDASGTTDTDGTVASYAWAFGDGQTGTGVSPSHTFAAGGTYSVTLTATDDDGATGTRTADVTVVDGSVVTLAQDAFGRTVASGWGTADVGGAWTAPSTALVTGGAGQMRLAAAGSSVSSRLPGISATSTDTLVTTWLDRRPNGSGAYTLVRGRITTGGEYRVKTSFRSNGTITASLVRAASNGTETTIAASRTVGATYTAGTRLLTRLEVTGTSPTVVRAKIWPAGQAEPSAWLLQASDSTAGLQVAGHVGLAAILSTTTTTTPVLVQFDDLSVVGPAA